VDGAFYAEGGPVGEYTSPVIMLTCMMDDDDKKAGLCPGRNPAYLPQKPMDRNRLARILKDTAASTHLPGCWSETFDATR